MLIDELLALPEQVARLQVETDRRFHELTEAQRRTEERVAAFLMDVVVRGRYQGSGADKMLMVYGSCTIVLC